MTPYLGTLRQHLLERRHTALLVAIVAALAVRPLFGDAASASIVFSLSFLGLLLVALYTTQVDELLGEREHLILERKKRRIIALTLAVLAVAGRLLLLFAAPGSGAYRFVSVVWLLFLAYVTGSELRALLRQREITGEAISMSVSVYLLMGLTWGLLYIMIHEYQPGAFNIDTLPAGADLATRERHLFPVFIYFSLTTLSTVGFGDVTPLSLQARYAAAAEGITGQFYLAILVARLVGLQLSRAAVQARGKSGTTEAKSEPDRDR